MAGHRCFDLPPPSLIKGQGGINVSLPISHATRILAHPGDPEREKFQGHACAHPFESWGAPRPVLPRSCFAGARHWPVDEWRDQLRRDHQRSCAYTGADNKKRVLNLVRKALHSWSSGRIDAKRDALRAAVRWFVWREKVMTLLLQKCFNFRLPPNPPPPPFPQPFT